jgi:hypothetical protein
MHWMTAKRCWTLGLIVTVVAIGWRLAFLERFTKVWIDEAMVADFYRIAFDETRIGAAATHPDGSPRLPPILWGTIYEAALFAPFGVSLATVRILGLISGILLGFTFAWLLRTLGSSLPIATLLAIAMPFEIPLFKSWALCRIDAAAIAAANVGLICWLRAFRSEPHNRLGAFLAGFFAALALLVWPTSLATVAGYAVIGGLHSAGAPWRQNLRGVAVAVLGGLTCLVLGLLILYPQPGFRHLMADLTWHKEMATGAVASLVDSDFGAQLTTIFQGVICRSVGIAGLVALLPFAFRQSRRTALQWIIPIAVAVIPCLAVQPLHLYRVVYLLPLIFVALGMLIERTSPRLALRVCMLVCTANLVLWLVGKSAESIRHWEGRDYGAYERQLTAIIPDGALVYDSTYEAYYMGLRHRWVYSAEYRPPWLKEPAASPMFIITRHPEKFAGDGYRSHGPIGHAREGSKDYGAYVLEKLPAGSPVASR